jgi:organic radical activating enzyme
VFVRLAGCNLRCDWCDSTYTWDWAHYDPKSEVAVLDVADVTLRVQREATVEVIDGPIHNVVITGGEPLLQRRALHPLASAFKAQGLRIEVETNGTISPGSKLAALVDQWNVSPKLANSGNGASERDVPTALESLSALTTAYFKFVVVEPADLTEVEAFARRYGVEANRVVLMPEGTTTEALAVRSGWVVEACQRHGYRFSPRLHILLWGNERGK